MTSRQFAIGIDIGGTNTKMGIISSEAELVAYQAVPTSKTLSPEAFLESLSRLCADMLKSHTGLYLGGKEIVGLGAGAPMANFETGKIDYAPNLGWRDVPLKSLFEKYFHCHALIENDANLAAVGEKKWGAGKNYSDFVLVTLGTGVGTGIILNNKLHRGYGALGAEGGHILIPHSSHRPCSCGGMNHLESYLSAAGIKKTIQEMTQLDWSIEELGNHLHAKNPLAIKVANQLATELATGLCSIGVLLGPQAFIIGGGVSRLGEEFNQLIKTKLDQEIHFSLRGQIEILTATLSSEQGAIFGGAAEIFDEV